VPERGFTDYIGTRYDEADLYGHILKKDGILKSLIKIWDPDTHEPSFPGRFTKEGIEQLREDQGEYIFSCQNELNPIPKKDQQFMLEWLVPHFTELPEVFVIVILVDPANARKKSAKYTSIQVFAITPDKRWYLVDGAFDKLSPTMRAKVLFRLVKKWRAHLDRVVYETIGFQETDKVIIERMMENYSCTQSRY